MQSRTMTFVSTFATALLATTLAQAAKATVHLTSGRRFTAEIDARTNEHRLWLRFETAASMILRPIDWAHVDRAVVGAETMDGPTLRQRAGEFKTAAAEQPVQPTPSSPSTPIENGASTGDGSQKTNWRENEVQREQLNLAEMAGHGFGQALLMVPPVRSVRADAYLANWDSDVENDGLIVHVMPISANGGVTAMDGSVEIEWLADHRLGSGETHGFRRIGRWTRRVTLAQCGPSGVCFRLPIQAVHPEFDLDIAPRSVVNIRLVAPGHGVMETTVTDIRVRPYSAVRDALQLRTKRRFFPSERTGRGK